MKNVKVEEEVWRKLTKLKYEKEYSKISDVVKEIMTEAGYLGGGGEQDEL